MCLRLFSLCYNFNYAYSSYVQLNVRIKINYPVMNPRRIAFYPKLRDPDIN